MIAILLIPLFVVILVGVFMFMIMFGIRRFFEEVFRQ